MRSISTAHVHMNCLTGASIDPCKFGLNEMMECFILQGIYSCCPSISHKVAHAESVPQSDARAGRLQFPFVYSESVILASDTHSCRNLY